MIGQIKPVYAQESKSAELEAQHWLHYCGTCKTIGKHYGQIYRTGLNYDLTILGQLAADAAGIRFETRNIRPRQCFSKAYYDQDADDLMRYISALHIFWYKIKLQDNAKDEESRFAKIMAGGMRRSFAKCCRELESLGISLSWIRQQLDHHEQLEESGELYSIKEYAEPAGRITAYLFEQAACIAGAGAQAEAFHRLGYGIGTAIYIADAAEDLEKDISKHRFNPYALKKNFRLELAKEQAKQDALAVWSSIPAVFKELSVGDLTTQQFSGRVHHIIQVWKGERHSCTCSASKAKPITLDENSSCVTKTQTAAASAAMTLLPGIAYAQRASDENFWDNGSGCCLLCCICTACFGICAKPASSADCAIQGCCADDPNCR